MHNSTGNNYSDKELIDGALSNDPAAFRKIIQRSERLVAQILHRMVDDREDRKDLAQDVYLKAFRSLPKFNYESRLSTWICQISYNTCIDYLRKQKIRPLFKQDFDYDSATDSSETNSGLFNSNESSSDSLAIKKEVSEIIKIEIEKLSPVYRTLVTLFHTEELSYEEIGQVTGLPDGTIKSYLSRARKTLRDNILLNYSKTDL